MSAFDKSIDAVSKLNQELRVAAFAPHDVPSALRDRGSDFEAREDGTVEYCLSTRQGGGNRECYCEDCGDSGHEEYCLAANNEELQAHPFYLADEDDDFDCTYAYFTFRTNLTHDDLTSYAEAVAKAKLDGSVGELAEAGVIVNDSGEVEKALSVLRGAERAKEVLARAEEATAKQAGAAEVAKRVKENALEAAPTGDDLAVLKKGMGHRFPEYRMSDIENYFTKREAAREAYALHSAAMDLPEDNPLRSYLVGDRGTGSYQTTEGRGRSKRTVTKTYERGSLLGKELADATRAAENAEKRHLETIDAITKDAIEAAERAEEALRAAQAAEEKAAQALRELRGKRG